MKSVTACIFDLDGVIVETSHYHFLAWQRLAREIGIDFSEKENEQLKGVSRKRSLERILAIGNKSLDDQTFHELMEKKNGWYLEYLEDLKPGDALPMVVPFLDSLREDGIKCALASSSKNAPAIIAKLGLNDYFDTLKDGNSVKIAKPNPDIFLQAAEAIDESPANCVVFEDALAGIEAARNAGMRCVGVGSPDVLHEADHIIGSFEELNLLKFKQLFD